MTSYTTGVGVTFSQSFDIVPRVTQLTSNLVGANWPASLVTVDPGIGYTAAGSLRKIMLGNGLTETAAYDGRLQPCRSNVNSSGSALVNCSDAMPSGTVQDFQYGFNPGTSDNGNLMSFSASGAQTFNRSYTYDALNRLQSLSAPADICSGLAWTYDAWGNRSGQSITGGTCNSFQNSANTQNRLVGFQYDSAGNMTNDGRHTYTYDAENRLLQVDGGATASYVYDALGHRVEKATPAGKIDYLSDLERNVVTEID